MGPAVAAYWVELQCVGSLRIEMLHGVSAVSETSGLDRAPPPAGALPVSALVPRPTHAMECSVIVRWIVV